MTKNFVSNVSNSSLISSAPFDVKAQVSWDASTSDVEKEVKERLGLNSDQIDLLVNPDLAREEEGFISLKEWEEAYNQPAIVTEINPQLSLELKIKSGEILGAALRNSGEITKTQYQEALNLIEQAISLNPEGEWLYYDRGMIRNKLGDFEGAKKDFTKELELTSSSFAQLRCYWERSLIYTREGEYEKSSQDLANIVNAPSDPEGFFKRAERSIKTNNDSIEIEKEIEIERNLFAEKEAGARLTNERVIKFLSQEDQQKEMAKNPRLKEIFDEFTSSEPVNYFKNSDPSLKTPKYMLGYTPKFQRKWFAALVANNTDDRTANLIAAKEVAAQEIERSKANGNLVMGRENKGMCSLELGLYEEAVSDFSNQIAETRHFSGEAYGSRGLAHLSLGKNQEALSDLSYAIKIQEKLEILREEKKGHFSKFLHHSRGIAYAKAGFYQEALADFSEEIENNPNPESFRRRGFVHKLLGQEKKSEADFAKADNIGFWSNLDNTLAAKIPIIASVIFLMRAVLAFNEVRRGPTQQPSREEDFRNKEEADFRLQMMVEGYTKFYADSLSKEDKNTILLIPSFEQASNLFKDLILAKNAADLNSVLDRKLSDMFEDEETRSKLKSVIIDELLMEDCCENKVVQKIQDGRYKNFPKNHIYECYLEDPDIHHNPLNQARFDEAIAKYENYNIRVMDSFLKEAYEEKAKLMLEVDPKVKISAINEDMQVEENLQPATLLPNEPAEEKVGRLVSKVKSVEKLEEIKVAEREL